LCFKVTQEYDKCKSADEKLTYEDRKAKSAGKRSVVYAVSHHRRSDECGRKAAKYSFMRSLDRSQVFCNTAVEHHSRPSYVYVGTSPA